MPDRQFKIGDRVVITSRAHPWNGCTGVIIGQFRIAGFDWTVRLERDDAFDGHECAAEGRQLSPERRERAR